MNSDLVFFSNNQCHYGTLYDRTYDFYRSYLVEDEYVKNDYATVSPYKEAN